MQNASFKNFEIKIIFLWSEVYEFNCVLIKCQNTWTYQKLHNVGTKFGMGSNVSEVSNARIEYFYLFYFLSLFNLNISP